MQIILHFKGCYCGGTGTIRSPSELLENCSTLKTVTLPVEFWEGIGKPQTADDLIERVWEIPREIAEFGIRKEEKEK